MGLVGGSRSKDTIDCGYLCKCGSVVAGDQGERRWERCVVCERVVEREVGGSLMGVRRVDRAERVDRVDRVDRVEMVDRVERAERAERMDRVEIRRETRRETRRERIERLVREGDVDGEEV